MKGGGGCRKNCPRRVGLVDVQKGPVVDVRDLLVELINDFQCIVSLSDV